MHVPCSSRWKARRYLPEAQNDYSEYGEVVSDEVHTPALERVVVAGLGVVVEVLHRGIVVAFVQVSVTETDVCQPVVAVAAERFLPRLSCFLVLALVEQRDSVVND